MPEIIFAWLVFHFRCRIPPEESGSESEKLATQKLFQALTERGGDNRGIRRPTRLADLSEIIGVEIDMLKAIVERFRKPGRTFLMPPIEVTLASPQWGA